LNSQNTNLTNKSKSPSKSNTIKSVKENTESAAEPEKKEEVVAKTEEEQEITK